MSSGPEHGELLPYLAHVRFPADAQQIRRLCEEQGAPAECLRRLEDLPAGVYVEPDTVLQALR
ncbi:DUF2795 domain-containing protein [Saccharopolyspora sp. CA-218241]|uniref:DUF2795 domain-containing protein n=1 Tax=Saccharopolyspora sp. CA-218241 TaxID=3240027 RepID=UPI003D9937FF